MIDYRTAKKRYTPHVYNVLRFLKSGQLVAFFDLNGESLGYYWTGYNVPSHLYNAKYKLVVPGHLPETLIIYVNYKEADAKHGKKV